MRLSIIIPMYNAENYIERCVNSVYRQGLSLSDFEVIIINDGSTDNSAKIVGVLCQAYTNLFLLNKRNGGQGAARNIGIEKAKGDYLMFIDSDDYLLDNQINDCLLKAEENHIDVCCMGIRRMLPSGKAALFIKPSFREDVVYSGTWLLLHYYFPSSACAHFFRRELLCQSGLRFQTKIMHEDVDFQLKLFSFINRFMFCNKEVYVYEYNPNSTDRLMNIEKQKRSLWSRMQICVDLREFSQSERIDRSLALYYERVSNSQMLAVVLQLWRNHTIDKQFKKYLIEESYHRGLLPISGRCFSWKSNILKIIVNIILYFKLIK